MGDPNVLGVSWNGATLFTWTDFVANGWINVKPNFVAHGTDVLQFGFEDDDNAFALDDISVAAVTGGPPPPPTPAGLQVVAGNGQVTLSWAAIAGVTFYNVYRSTSSGGETILVGGTSTNFTDTDLDNGVTYYYVVQAGAPGVGSGLSGEMSATPVAPSATALKLGGITFAGGGGGGFGFCFTNVPSVNFTVYGSTDVTLPFVSWPLVGQPIEVPNGSYSLYQFIDPEATNQVRWFYRVTSP